mgnify:FL=1
MKNRTLAGDYVVRARNRLAALDVLFEKKSYADVVREAQELVELALNGLLRFSDIEVPRIHDVSQVMEDQLSLLPPEVHAAVPELGKISRELRRDRELAFYGSEDLTPSEFYREDDATKARNQARWVVEQVSNALKI